MTFGRVLLAIFGIAFLMVVHETGHYLAARRFGMRVLTYSIGIGPAIWKHQPKGSPTTYQIAIIPFMAYVRIAGINPFEEVDPNDKESYANASLLARIITIFAGSFGNYVFASILIFLGMVGWGAREMEDKSMQVQPHVDGPAAAAGIKRGDKILSINGIPIPNWSALSKEISCRPGQEIDVEVDRKGEKLHLHPKVQVSIPQPGAQPKGMIRVSMDYKEVPVSAKDAAIAAVKQPPMVIYLTVQGIWRMISGAEKPNVLGFRGVVEEVAGAIEEGPGDALQFLGRLSAYLGGFNLLPLPGLDGGRLIFLIYEAIARRRANEKVEAAIHAVGIFFFLALMMVVTVREFLPKPTTPVIPTTRT
jgi:regulator of sigma E protease